MDTTTKKKWSMENIKGILLDKAIELVFLIAVFSVGIFVQNKIFEAEIAENKKQIELLTAEVNKAVNLFNQHLVWSEGRSVSLDELRLRVERLEGKVEAMREREFFHKTLP